MAKALLVAPDSQSIAPVEVDSAADIAALIGYDTLASDALGDGADRLYFDEECFIRATPGRFRIDALVPVSGRAIVVGVAGDERLIDVSLTIEQLRTRIRFD